MSLFDLLLILTVLGTAVMLVIALVRLLRGKAAAAKRTVLALAAYLACYFAALIGTSLAQSQKQIPIGTPQCFDEWCLTVASVKREPTRITITLGVSNQGKRRPQSEPQTFVYLLDQSGRKYRSAGASNLNSMIQPGETITCTQSFTLPEDVTSLALAIGHPFGPDFFVIGDSHSLLHKPTIVPLPY